MNRQMKRAQERAERQQRRGGAAGGPAAGGPAGPSGTPGAPRTRPSGGGKRRTGVRQFLREVRQELQKVNWPTRRELVTYTVVVLVTVTVLATYVFGLDFVFSKAIFSVLGR
jgi:preprotein translocase subunit SecE